MECEECDDGRNLIKLIMMRQNSFCNIFYPIVSIATHCANCKCKCHAWVILLLYWPKGQSANFLINICVALTLLQTSIAWSGSHTQHSYMPHQQNENKIEMWDRMYTFLWLTIKVVIKSFRIYQNRWMTFVWCLRQKEINIFSKKIYLLSIFSFVFPVILWI